MFKKNWIGWIFVILFMFSGASAQTVGVDTAKGELYFNLGTITMPIPEEIMSMFGETVAIPFNIQIWVGEKEYWVTVNSDTMFYFPPDTVLDTYPVPNIYYLKLFTDNQMYEYTIARDTSIHFICSPADTSSPPPDTLQPELAVGLFYRVYEWEGYVLESVLDLMSLTPVDSGVCLTFHIGMARKRAEFGIEYEGLIHHDKTEDVQFQLYHSHDDGSRLYLNGVEIIDFDGRQPLGTKNSKWVKLYKGHNQVRELFKEQDKTQDNKVLWRFSEDEEFVEIPQFVLFHGDVEAPAPPDTLVVDPDPDPDPEHPKVVVSWDPNSEEDLAGYKVYWGTEPGVYVNSHDVGNVLSYIIIHPGSGTYYYVVTAYDTHGNESDPSIEVSKTLTE